MHERLGQNPTFLRPGQQLRPPTAPIDLSALLARVIDQETSVQSGAGQRPGRAKANAGVMQPSPGHAASATQLPTLDKPAPNADALAGRSHDGRDILAPSLHDAEVAETSLRPSLLPLRPLRATPVAMGPAGTASIAAQAGESQGEGAQTGEELDALAAKIKRILDEEARRHGINV